MATQCTEEKWEKVKYSKSKINKAGKVLLDAVPGSEEEKEALEILNNWRASHAYPLQVIASELRRASESALVVQRLKRLDSIVAKLKRIQGMSLYGMQDIGGCRVIVDLVDDVYMVLNEYKDSRKQHILKRENDYIINPKKSGYRSYHIVYQFYSDEIEEYNKNMRVEIQLRTRLQHTWATAVEMMGIYTKSALKASIGDTNVLRFFALVSSVFARIEGTAIVPDTADSYDQLVKEIKCIDQKYNIISKLSALNVAIDHVKDNKEEGYYILILNYESKMLKIRHFTTSEIETATEVYNEIEGLKEISIDAVLVSANSFETLRVAYPNYFSDIGEFVEMMRQILV